MVKQQLSAVTLRLLVTAVALGLATGCDGPQEQLGPAGNTQPQPGAARRIRPDTQPKQNTGQQIVSDGIVTVEDGKVTYGRPQMTEEVERQIYKSLSHRRNLARAIEEKVPGGNRGSQQIRQEYDLLLKGHMVRYGISQGDIDSIMRKGDEQGWK